MDGRVDWVWGRVEEEEELRGRESKEEEEWVSSAKGVVRGRWSGRRWIGDCVVDLLSSSKCERISLRSLESKGRG